MCTVLLDSDKYLLSGITFINLLELDGHHVTSQTLFCSVLPRPLYHFLDHVSNL